MKNKKIIISLNSAWNLINFRSGLIQALVQDGYELVAVAPYDQYAHKLAELGCRFVSIGMDKQGTNPFRDAKLLWAYFRLFLSERPDIYLGYTVKPNVYGSIAAALLGISVINNVAGLGTVFIQGGWKARVVRTLYKIAFLKSKTIFFQNNDDLEQFVEEKVVSLSSTALLPGSGVDLEKFSLNIERSKNAEKKFRFLLIARMLWDKGVGEYVEAAGYIRKEFDNVEFCLLGFVDVENPSAISKKQMDDWVLQGDVCYLGVSDDVRFEIENADCIVLPSYREGTPRTLLEAAAMAKPIITTNAIGCKNVVDDNKNGFLCEIANSNDLAEKMKKMLLLSDIERYQMGACGRRKMELEFDEKIVVEKYRFAIQKALQ